MQSASPARCPFTESMRVATRTLGDHVPDRHISDSYSIETYLCPLRQAERLSSPVAGKRPRLARADGTAADLTGGRGGNGCLISAARRAILDQELGLLGTLPTWARMLVFTCLYGSLSACLKASGELMLSSHSRCHRLA